MNSTGGFKIILFSKIPTNFNDCLDTNGDLKGSATGMEKIDTSYYLQKNFNLDIRPIGDGSNGFTLFTDNNGEDVNIEIYNEDGFYIKGVALIITGAKTIGDYVVAYARLPTPALCKESITIADCSEFVRHDSCMEV